jgi:hypothetical protein
MPREQTGQYFAMTTMIATMAAGGECAGCGDTKCTA